jgi:hypothetical protein
MQLSKLEVGYRAALSSYIDDLATGRNKQHI